MRSTGQPAAASTITDVTASAPQIAAALKPSTARSGKPAGAGDIVSRMTRRGPRAMANALDCRVRALRCSEAASRASEARVKDVLAEMAALWIKLASELERTHTVEDDQVL